MGLKSSKHTPVVSKALFSLIKGMLPICFLFLMIGTGAMPAAGDQVFDSSSDLTLFSIEDLMEMEIVSLVKTTQKISDIPAAVFVITQEDIRRSGVTSIPEALRMVPGFQVAKIDANTWAVTSRGFNDLFGEKLLILIDGRSIYSPLLSGTIWDEDVFLEDVERIEVIRGPGAALWGANAVNGIINIVTKHSRDTQGALVTGGAGNEEKGFGGVRAGSDFAGNGFYRVYAKYFNRDDSVFSSGEDAADEWERWQAGFRLDWEKNDKDTLVFHGDVYTTDSGGTTETPVLGPALSEVTDFKTDVKGWNVLARWDHKLSPTSDTTTQIFFNRSDRKEIYFDAVQETFDIDFQHHFTLGRRNDFLWGLGYRLYQDKIDNSFRVSFDPDSRTNRLLSAFVQDRITLREDRWYLTLGSKFEHNDYTGFEIQPNARLLWKPREDISLWASISRAVRTPGRLDSDSRINFIVLPYASPPPNYNLISLFGNDDLESEELIAYEAGFRYQITPGLSLDITGFYNKYDNLITLDVGTPYPEISPAPLHLVTPLTIVDKMKGETYGVEIAASWNPWDFWKLAAAYSYLQIYLHNDGSVPDALFNVEGFEGNSPHHQLSLQSRMDLFDNFELDLWLRYVDNLPNMGIPSYVTLDARIGWHISDNLELSLNGQNLFDNRHPEGTTYYNEPAQVERGFYGKLTWRFR